MLLDGLYQTIEKLRERIPSHQDKLSQSEALTRNILIDPLLRALGWDTEDPDLVFPEHKLGNGKADYALLNKSKPIIVIEAKKLGTPLDSVAYQGIGYCTNDGIAYFAVTDGRKWDLYQTHLIVPLKDKKIVHFDIQDDALSDVCLNALALWRRSTQEGVVRPGRSPLLEPQDPPPTLAPAHGAGNSTPGNWQTLTQLIPVKRVRPLEIQFPDKTTKQIEFWVDIPKDALNWLIHQEKLDETVTQIRRSNKSYILSHSPVHPSGKDFRSPHKIGRLFLETNHTPVDHVKNANVIIEIAGKGVTTDQFSVRLPE